MANCCQTSNVIGKIRATFRFPVCLQVQERATSNFKKDLTRRSSFLLLEDNVRPNLPIHGAVPTRVTSKLVFGHANTSSWRVAHVQKLSHQFCKFNGRTRNWLSCQSSKRPEWHMDPLGPMFLDQFLSCQCWKLQKLITKQLHAAMVCNILM